MDTEILLPIGLAVYGAFVAWVAERYGKFQDLPSTQKQFYISLFTLVIPAVSGVVTQFGWPFGADPTETLTGVALILAPMFTWLAGQFAHQLDRLVEQAMAYLKLRRQL